jgi:hypothetical protein
MTKAIIIRDLVAANPGMSRKDMIALLVEKADVSERAAGSYVYKAKKQIERVAAGLPLSFKAAKRRAALIAAGVDVESAPKAKKEKTPKVAKKAKAAKKSASVPTPVVVATISEISEQAQNFVEWRKAKSETRPVVIAGGMTDEEFDEVSGEEEYVWPGEVVAEARELLRVQMG